MLTATFRRSIASHAGMPQSAMKMVTHRKPEIRPLRPVSCTPMTGFLVVNQGRSDFHRDRFPLVACACGGRQPPCRSDQAAVPGWEQEPHQPRTAKTLSTRCQEHWAASAPRRSAPECSLLAEDRQSGRDPTGHRRSTILRPWCGLLHSRSRSWACDKFVLIKRLHPLACGAGLRPPYRLSQATALGWEQG